MASDLTRSDPRAASAAAPATGERAVVRLGFWAAVCATALTIVFVALTIAFPSAGWVGIEAYAEDFRAVDVVQLVPVLLLAPVVVVLMGCADLLTSAARRVFSHLAVAFASVYAAVVATNYVIQLVVVRPRIAAGELEGLTLLAMPNPGSVFVALEITGYGFFALAALAASAGFAGSTRSVRWLLLATACTGVVGAVGGLAAQPTLMLIGFGLSLVAFLAAAFLLAVRLGRLARAGNREGQ